ncbi:myosin-9-like [Dorcoceras hygrometricum]|uniref:Myosin-9-like n=1 Tax=Dorcoceras hygrometricum TaxID=472368 RepID=A0A2Z7D103_9LAMI|nr:myosin-9-like [Dorcoceras hygrometricum]
MWFVLTDGPIKIMRPNTAIAISAGAAKWVEKTRMEWTTEDKKKAHGQGHTIQDTGQQHVQ